MMAIVGVFIIAALVLFKEMGAHTSLGEPSVVLVGY